MDLPLNNSVAATELPAGLFSSIDAQLTIGALPSEIEAFSDESRKAAAAFMARTAADRVVGQPATALESISEGARHAMRLAIVNDDMPWLVDSIASLLVTRGIAIHRLLHPVVRAQRSILGRLEKVVPVGDTNLGNESLIYMELDRVDAKERRSLINAIEKVLSDIRLVFDDRQALIQGMRESAGALSSGESAEMLHWLLDGNMTLLGLVRTDLLGSVDRSLGIARSSDDALLTGRSSAAAIASFEAGNSAPLFLKSDRVSTVHRRVPVDLILLPRREGASVVGLDIYAGLWTSDALAARPDRVPLLRRRLSALEMELGFDPSCHAGKAVRHAIHQLPRDLMIALPSEALRDVALTAMSLGDRPRPKLVLVEEMLGRHLFAFVWLPRDELTSSRRDAVGKMLADASRGRIVASAIDLGDSDLALIRYTVALGDDGVVPRSEPLDRRFGVMVRGWSPAVSAALSKRVGPGRATRLAMIYAGAFPIGYRSTVDAVEAAADIIWLAALDGRVDRSARLYPAAGDGPDSLHLKIYRTGGLVALSDVVPVLENFGFVVIEEVPTALENGLGQIHQFLLGAPEGCSATILDRATVAEKAIADVLKDVAENDEFNTLIVTLGIEPRAVVLLRAWFRYLRQTGLPYGLATTARALTRAPTVTRALIALFDALHGPELGSATGTEAARAAIAEGLVAVSAIDDDRVLRRMHALIEAILRTNAFSPAAEEALVFKIDSAKVRDLPAPRPWREIWVYCRRVEGIHLRGGPIARGGLRWSDRRDDFRTEILGLMKAQVVKNAVIVPTGAKGGFYPKQLPSPVDRGRWIEEGTQSYRIFIRSLLSVTDNIVDGKVVHPQSVRVPDGQDPYLVVAADKGTATFSDVANAIALEQGYWLGDAFASGGSNGYDHKAMAITARGAWVSVTRHFAEAGLDVQSDPVTVTGCGDMSGDVFGNGMLLSKSIRLVAAFDHRHVFIDPNPCAAASYEERARLFALPASSWASYDKDVISAGGGVFDRSRKVIPVSVQAGAALGIVEGSYEPAALIQAILKAPVDLLWFGGIGTYIKAAGETNADAGDPANDANRVDAIALRAKVIGEGANLSTTQAGRIEFCLRGGRCNTDFIDNSAGVDCSDNEVNIKIALSSEMAAGRLSIEDRNFFLASMTDDVAKMVLEDNRLQTLALSAAERGGPAALSAQLGIVAELESTGRLDRIVEGLLGNDDYARRVQDGHGLTRPELAVILSHAKLALQAAIEASPIPDDALLLPILHRAFPGRMQELFKSAIERHRLRKEIIATKVANVVVNRLGLQAPFELAEEEGVGLARVAGAYLCCDHIFELGELYSDIEAESISEAARLEVLDAVARITRLQIADMLRVADPASLPGEIISLVSGGVRQMNREGHSTSSAAEKTNAHLRERLVFIGTSPALTDRIVRLYELDGAVATSALAARFGWREADVAAAQIHLGEALGLDWAAATAQRMTLNDPWDRLFVAALARDLKRIPLEFLARSGPVGPELMVSEWLAQHRVQLERFARLVQRARAASSVSLAMIGQITAQAEILLAR